MSPDPIAYSAHREDLYFPCAAGEFFPSGTPRTEAALCVEFARLAYCRQQSGFGFNEGEIRTILANVGFTNCKFFESGGPQNRGAHCFLAFRSGGDEANDLAILAFRGTDADDPTDLGDDADILLESWAKGGRVHSGFARAFEQVRSDIDRSLHATKCRILYTGHSLGAAMATLLASLREPDCLYTFGSPRVGNAQFVDSMKAVPVRRYVDCCDLVTRVPPKIIGYAHVGKPYYINLDRQVEFNPDSKVVEADQSRAREKYMIEYAWKSGNVSVRDLADHAPINYVSAINANES